MERTTARPGPRAIRAFRGTSDDEARSAIERAGARIEAVRGPIAELARMSAAGTIADAGLAARAKALAAELEAATKLLAEQRAALAQAEAIADRQERALAAYSLATADLAAAADMLERGAGAADMRALLRGEQPTSTPAGRTAVVPRAQARPAAAPAFALAAQVRDAVAAARPVYDYTAPRIEIVEKAVTLRQDARALAGEPSLKVATIARALAQLFERAPAVQGRCRKAITETRELRRALLTTEHGLSRLKGLPEAEAARKAAALDWADLRGKTIRLTRFPNMFARVPILETLFPPMGTLGSEEA